MRPLRGHGALDEFRLQNLGDGAEFVIVLAGQQDFVILFVELDGGFGVLQVVALIDFLGGLVDGVGDFGEVDFGDDVKGVFGHVGGTEI